MFSCQGISKLDESFNIFFAYSLVAVSINEIEHKMKQSLFIQKAKRSNSFDKLLKKYLIRFSLGDTLKQPLSVGEFNEVIDIPAKKVNKIIQIKIGSMMLINFLERLVEFLDVVIVETQGVLDIGKFLFVDDELV